MVLSTLLYVSGGSAGEENRCLKFYTHCCKYTGGSSSGGSSICGSGGSCITCDGGGSSGSGDEEKKDKESKRSRITRKTSMRIMMIKLTG